jgi:hypothetical protein
MLLSVIVSPGDGLAGKKIDPVAGAGSVNTLNSEKG